ncbi:MAG: class I SAM-dependent methyltransferase, partial [Ktedonobacteraceae bacterium]
MSSNSDMSSNQEYLLHEQYKDASNFNTRIRTMQSAGINLPDWYKRIFHLIKMAPHNRVLELGCGPGYLWQNNLDDLPLNCEITLSDFSPGMLEAAQNNLSGSSQPFTFKVIDAQAISSENAQFDVVIANLMLYHVPDRPRALSEIARVLKPTGHFYAATFSQSNFTYLEKFIRDSEVASWMNLLSFSLENGTEQLSPWFSHVALHRLENTIVLTEAQPLVEIIRSGTARASWDEAKFQALQELIE